MRDAAAVRSMFASISRRYDFLNHLLSLNQDKRWRRKTVEASSLNGNDVVLDVCTGTADLAIAYAAEKKGAGFVVGADFCPEMLVLGNRKLKSEKDGARPRVALLAADTLQLPFRNSVFDVVSVAFGIRNVSDLKSGIIEMARVAKEGGRVMILEFSLPENKLFGGLYLSYFTKILPVIGRLISRSNNNAYSYLPASVLRFPKKSEMMAVMEGCGLAGIAARQYSFGIVTLYTGFKPRSPRNGGKT
jgi:demethylmenaquinone methyltransferase/2-methoxy-6-polyprenyl-1,4-benzoquinol methylase